MITIDYSNFQPRQNKATLKDILTAGAVVFLPALFLLLISAH